MRAATKVPSAGRVNHRNPQTQHEGGAAGMGEQSLTTLSAQSDHSTGLGDQVAAAATSRPHDDDEGHAGLEPTPRAPFSSETSLTTSSREDLHRHLRSYRTMPPSTRRQAAIAGPTGTATAKAGAVQATGERFSPGRSPSPPASRYTPRRSPTKAEEQHILEWEGSSRLGRPTSMSAASTPGAQAREGEQSHEGSEFIESTGPAHSTLSHQQHDTAESTGRGGERPLPSFLAGNDPHFGPHSNGSDSFTGAYSTSAKASSPENAVMNVRSSKAYSTTATSGTPRHSTLEMDTSTESDHAAAQLGFTKVMEDRVQRLIEESNEALQASFKRQNDTLREELRHERAKNSDLERERHNKTQSSLAPKIKDDPADKRTSFATSFAASFEQEPSRPYAQEDPAYNKRIAGKQVEYERSQGDEFVAYASTLTSSQEANQRKDQSMRLRRRIDTASDRASDVYETHSRYSTASSFYGSDRGGGDERREQQRPLKPVNFSPDFEHNAKQSPADNLTNLLRSVAQALDERGSKSLLALAQNIARDSSETGIITRYEHISSGGATTVLSFKDFCSVSYLGTTSLSGGYSTSRDAENDLITILSDYNIDGRQGLRFVYAESIAIFKGLTSVINKNTSMHLDYILTSYGCTDCALGGIVALALLLLAGDAAQATSQSQVINLEAQLVNLCTVRISVSSLNSDFHLKLLNQLQTISGSLQRLVSSFEIVHKHGNATSSLITSYSTIRNLVVPPSKADIVNRIDEQFKNLAADGDKNGTERFHAAISILRSATTSLQQLEATQIYDARTNATPPTHPGRNDLPAKTAGFLARLAREHEKHKTDIHHLRSQLPNASVNANTAARGGSFERRGSQSRQAGQQAQGWARRPSNASSGGSRSPGGRPKTCFLCDQEGHGVIECPDKDVAREFIANRKANADKPSDDKSQRASTRPYSASRAASSPPHRATMEPSPQSDPRPRITGQDTKRAFGCLSGRSPGPQHETFVDPVPELTEEEFLEVEQYIESMTEAEIAEFEDCEDGMQQFPDAEQNFEERSAHFRNLVFGTSKPSKVLAAKNVELSEDIPTKISGGVNNDGVTDGNSRTNMGEQNLEMDDCDAGCGARKINDDDDGGHKSGFFASFTSRIRKSSTPRSPRRTSHYTLNIFNIFGILGWMTAIFSGMPTEFSNNPRRVGTGRTVSTSRSSITWSLNRFFGSRTYIVIVLFLFIVGLTFAKGLTQTEPGIAILAFGNTNQSSEIYVDSGAEVSNITDRRHFKFLSRLDKPVTITGVSGEQMKCYESGTACFTLLDHNGLPIEIEIEDVLFNGNGVFNLISVAQLNKSSYNVHFDVNGASFSTTDERTVIPLHKAGGLFRLGFKGWNRNIGSTPILAGVKHHDLNKTNTTHPALSKAELLHLRFHASFPKISKLCEQMEGITPLTPKDLPAHRCIFCDEANCEKQPMGSESKSTYASDHDGWSVDQFDLGQDTLTTDGNRYVFLFVMLHSRFIHVELTKDRSADSVCEAFKNVITKQGFAPKMIRSDNGKEFESPEWFSLCDERNIKREKSNPHSQHQNGIAEAGVNKLARYMRLHLIMSGLENEFWGHAVRHAADIVNHLPHRSINNEIPIIKAGIKPYLSMFRAFGCRATVYVYKSQREHHKLSPHGIHGIYVGVGRVDGSKAFRIYLPETREIKLSKNVVFDETLFPFREVDQRYSPNHTFEFKRHLEPRDADPTELLNNYETVIPGYEDAPDLFDEPDSLVTEDFSTLNNDNQTSPSVQVSDDLTSAPLPPTPTTSAGSAPRLSPARTTRATAGSAGATGSAGASGSAGAVGPFTSTTRTSSRRSHRRVDRSAGEDANRNIKFGESTIKGPDNLTLPSTTKGPDNLQPVGSRHIDNVDDLELVDFMIQEEILFPINGNKWKGHENKVFKSQCMKRAWRRPRGPKHPKELFVDVAVIDSDSSNNETLEMNWLPTSTTRRDALCLRGALKEAAPNMSCLWDLRDFFTDNSIKITRNTTNGNNGLKGFAAGVQKAKAFVVRKKTTPTYLAVAIMMALSDFASNTNETPLVMSAEPKSQKESFKRPDRDHWATAEMTELQTLLKMGTFELVNYRRDMGPLLRTKWVYKLKTDEFGNTVKYKARLVVRGDMQSEDTYDDTYSPTSRCAAMRSVIAIATEMNWTLKHFDVTAAFISAKVDRPLYLAPPPGYEDVCPPGTCLLLNNSLYGLRQASHLYWKRLQTWLLDYGFTQADDEGTLFRIVRGGESMILSMYVDDGLVAASSDKIYDDFLTEFKKAFSISDQGDLHYYLGVKVTRDLVKGTTDLSQAQYCTDLLERFGMEDARTAVTPFEYGTHLTSEDCCDKMDASNKEQIRHYQTIVGALLYLSGNTRPDIAFAVNQCARFMSCPGPSHHIAAKRILRYLKGTKDLSLRYRRGLDNPNVLIGFVDADHAGNPEDRISVSGHIVFCNGGPVSWSSKRQPIVALSSAEAEFYAASIAACETEYLRKMYDSLGFKQEKPTTLYEDNQGTIFMSRSVGAFNRSKHIDTRVFRLRELVASGVLSLTKVLTTYNVADIFTKGLAGPVFAEHRSYFLF